MHPRTILLVGLVVLSTTVLGCAAAGIPPTSSAVATTRPTPVDSVAPLPSPTKAPAISPDGACPGSPADLSAILTLDSEQRIGCFGRSSLTFPVVVVAAVVDCVPVEVEPAWLWCPPAAFFAPPATAEGALGQNIATDVFAPSQDAAQVTLASAGTRTLEAHLAPGGGIDPAQLSQGATLLVTGHFDDPAATTCRVVSVGAGWQSPSPTDAVKVCRAAFVVTEVQASTPS